MEAYLGQVTLVGFNFAPRGSAICLGQIIGIASNTALFSLLGTTYGGDGRTTFGLPDLRGRAPIGVGQGPGFSDIRWGQRSGVQNTTLTSLNLPVHTHTATATFTPTTVSPVTVEGTLNVCSETASIETPSEGDYIATVKSGLSGLPCYIDAASVNSSNSVAVGGLNVVASGGETSGTVSVQNHTSGGSQPFSILNPYLGMYYVIWEVGVYPSRN